MRGLKIGSLFSGYGGLDLGIHQVFKPASTLWVSEFEKAPSRVLAERFPNAPNLGDVTAVDWSSVEPVDLICGGSPCQDLSTAGKRAGMKPGTRSGLWESMLQAIRIIKPSFVVWENVSGARTAKAFSLMEQNLGRVDGAKHTCLRALGRVLGDLASLGFDARWQSIRASHVGAAHHRERVFVFAYVRGSEKARQKLEEYASALPKLELVLNSKNPVLPTPTASVFGDGDPKKWVERNQKIYDQTGGCYGPDLATVVQLIKPDDSGKFGAWTPTFERWSKTVGRSCPELLELNNNGRMVISARFTEWLMGLPDGWITDVAGIGRRTALTMCGNGVVPQQAAAALRLMIKKILQG